MPIEPTSPSDLEEIYALFSAAIQDGEIAFGERVPDIEIFRNWLFSAKLDPCVTVLTREPIACFGALPFFAEWPAYFGTREIVVVPHCLELFETVMAEAETSPIITQLIARSASRDQGWQEFLKNQGFALKVKYEAILESKDAEPDSLLFFQKSVK